MVIFHSYVKLPEGKGGRDFTCHLITSPWPRSGMPMPDNEVDNQQRTKYSITGMPLLLGDHSDFNVISEVFSDYGVAWLLHPLWSNASEEMRTLSVGACGQASRGGLGMVGAVESVLIESRKARQQVKSQWFSMERDSQQGFQYSQWQWEQLFWRKPVHWESESGHQCGCKTTVFKRTRTSCPWLTQSQQSTTSMWLVIFSPKNPQTSLKIRNVPSMSIFFAWFSVPAIRHNGI